MSLGEFFNLDGMLRVFLTPRELVPQSADKYVLGTPPLAESDTFALRPPTRGWIKIPVKNIDDGVDLTLANPWLDMQAVCFSIPGFDENLDDPRMKAIQRFLETKLARDLNHEDAAPAFPNPDQIKSIGDSPEKGPRQLFEIHLVLGRIPRIFLFRTWWENSRLNAVVVGCRNSRFASEEETLHKLLDAAKLDRVPN